MYSQGHGEGGRRGGDEPSITQRISQLSDGATRNQKPKEKKEKKKKRGGKKRGGKKRGEEKRKERRERR